jgi:NodT family efflux transporter outer membrane factor (OMF) lipoprotein
VRSLIDNAQALEVKSGADFENTRLLLTAQLASSYFSLRALDADIALLSRSLHAQKKGVALVEDRHQQGLTSGLDLAQQQALTSGLESQLLSLKDQRDHFQNAIASLTGQPAPNFELPVLDHAAQILPAAPAVPLNTPAQVLERRPDVASAERAMAAANAQIGVARSAYYPSVNLGALLGSDANKSPLLFTAPAALWSLGLSAGVSLFDGGRIDANVSSAQAAYQQAASNYQQTVLNAFEEVQNTLNTRNALAQTQASLNAGAGHARTAFELTQARDQLGASSHLDVLINEQVWLGYERQRVQNQGQQLLNTVQLVKVLGGGW